MEFTADQKVEIEKLLKYVRQMEGIIRTSPSAEQKERVTKQLQQYREKLAAVTGGRADKLNLSEIESAIGAVPGPKSNAAPSGKTYNILDKYPVQQASKNSSDSDLNLMATMLAVVQREYWPVLTDMHTKLDFSFSSERDTVRTKLENAQRSLGVLIETIDEYAGAEKQDFREQLLKMKNKQTRLFLIEMNELFKTMREFLTRINQDLSSGGGVVTNKKDVLKFNPRFEEATVLEGQPLSEGLREFESFCVAAIERLNLPNFKKT